MIFEPDLPADALLARYDPKDGHYRDCFAIDLAEEIPLARYVEAFYTAWLFRCERVVLKYAMKKPSTDAEARAVALGETDQFAAWTVEDRTEDQLLMCDLHGSTRSWFKTEPVDTGTRAYFGSAVVSSSGVLPKSVTMFIPAHRLYSKLLLKGAVRRLRHSTFSA